MGGMKIGTTAPLANIAASVRAVGDSAGTALSTLGRAPARLAAPALAGAMVLTGAGLLGWKLLDGGRNSADDGQFQLGAQRGAASGYDTLDAATTAMVKDEDANAVVLREDRFFVHESDNIEQVHGSGHEGSMLFAPVVDNDVPDNVVQLQTKYGILPAPGWEIVQPSGSDPSDNVLLTNEQYQRLTDGTMSRDEWDRLVASS